jgi:hypothetical protein
MSIEPIGKMYSIQNMLHPFPYYRTEQDINEIINQERTYEME